MARLRDLKMTLRLNGYEGVAKALERLETTHTAAEADYEVGVSGAVTVDFPGGSVTPLTSIEGGVVDWLLVRDASGEGVMLIQASAGVSVSAAGDDVLLTILE
jgi:hypothetical protein